MLKGAQGGVGLAGVLALALGLMPGPAPAEAAAPFLALLEAQCSDPAAAPALPVGWAPVATDEATPLIGGIADLEARIEQVLDRALADEPDLTVLLMRRMAAWLAETRAGRMQAQLWQHRAPPALTLFRAAATDAMQIVHCRLMIEDAPPALTEALVRRFEILPEAQGMQVLIRAGGAEIATPAGREIHNRELLILPDWSPRTGTAMLLVGYGVRRMAQ